MYGQLQYISQTHRTRWCRLTGDLRFFHSFFPVIQKQGLKRFRVLPIVDTFICRDVF